MIDLFTLQMMSSVLCVFFPNRKVMETVLDFMIHHGFDPNSHQVGLRKVGSMQNTRKFNAWKCRLSGTSSCNLLPEVTPPSPFFILFCTFTFPFPFVFLLSSYLARKFFFFLTEQVSFISCQEIKNSTLFIFPSHKIMF